MSLDVSDCILLTSLKDVSSVTDLNVSGCTSLKSLDWRKGSLERLNVSGCTSLTYLDCYHNALTSLDVSGCTSLTDLDCSDNALTSLDVSGFTALKSLDCYDNQLTSLDVSGFTALEGLYCGHNALTSLDVSGCTAMKSLSCWGNNDLTSLDVSGFIALTELIVSDGLKELNVSGCTSLERLDFSNNIVRNLDVSGCTALTELMCYNSEMTSLDVSGCTSLTYLCCSDNQLTSLDVSGCTSLGRLECNDNRLTSLDVNGCPSLNSLNCSGNRLPLSFLYGIYNQLSELDYFDHFYASWQWDSIFLSVGETFDLSSERIIGKMLSSYEVEDAFRDSLPAFLWNENDFVFQFDYFPCKLVLRNTFAGDPIIFTWYISRSYQKSYYVMVTSNNTEWGTASIIGGRTYEEYLEGMEATVTATPRKGYRFVNWTKADGTVFSTEATYTFVVTENMELTAHFEKIPDGVGNEYPDKDNFRVYAQDRVIYLSDNRDRVEVYNALGQCVYSGHATAIPVQNGGLYIVRVGRNSYKVMVK